MELASRRPRASSGGSTTTSGARPRTTRCACSRSIPRERLEAAASDPEFLALYDRAIAALDEARAAHNTWWARNLPQLSGQSIAYFSAEFALHQSLPIYAGGLGVLAGDHCKEASDLGVPLVGVGFMYPQGYFHQHVSAEGWQEETNELLNWIDAPIEPATTPDGQPCLTAVPLDDRSVLVAVWRVRVGRVQLYLLDTNLEENAPWDRELSARLYGGDRETRIQQEIILGHRRRARPPGARHRAGRLSPERRACGVRRAAADSRDDRPRIELRRGARGNPADDDLHDAHAGARPATTRFRFTWSKNTWPAAGARSAPTASDSWRWDRTTAAPARSST